MKFSFGNGDFWNCQEVIYVTEQLAEALPNCLFFSWAATNDVKASWPAGTASRRAGAGSFPVSSIAEEAGEN